MTNRFAFPLWLLTGAVLAGCAVGPDYAAPRVAPITLASTSSAAAFSSDGVSAQSPWWDFLKDEQLTALIESALAHNHDILQSQASLAAARAAFDERALDRLPTVSGQLNYERSLEQRSYGGPPVRSLAQSYRAGFDVQWELDLFGRLNRLSQAASARAEAAQADLAQTRLSIAAEVARNYYEVLGAQRRLTLAQAQIANWRATLSVIGARVRLGSGLQEDMENAQSNLARSEATVAPLQVALDAARYRLDVLTGERPGTHAMPADKSADQAPLSTRLPLGDVDALIRHRPDVVKAERLLAAGTEDVGAATADLYPRFSLGGFIGFFALRDADLGIASRAFELTPGITTPVFPLGSARARLRSTQAQADSARLRYQQSLLQAQEEVENAVTRLAQYQQRVGMLLRSAQHGEAALKIADNRYRAGSGSYLAVLENQRALDDIRQEAAEAETASYLNVVSLYKALGWGIDKAGGDVSNRPRQHAAS